MTEKIPITSDEQKMAQEATEITEEEILARATGGSGVIKPIAGKLCFNYEGKIRRRGNRYFEHLPFGLRRYREQIERSSISLDPSPTSAFKRYLPDLNETPPAKRQKTAE